MFGRFEAIEHQKSRERLLPFFNENRPLYVTFIFMCLVLFRKDQALLPKEASPKEEDYKNWNRLRTDHEALQKSMHLYFFFSLGVIFACLNI